MVQAVTHLIAIAALLSASALALAAGLGGGVDRLIACLLAASAVFLGVAASRLLFLWKSLGAADVSGVLLGTIARIAVPASAWIACQLWAAPTISQNIAEPLLILYLIGLATETALVVQTIPRYRSRPAAEPASTNA